MTPSSIEIYCYKIWSMLSSPISLQINQLGAEVLHRDAYTMLHEMEPLFKLLQVTLNHCT